MQGKPVPEQAEDPKQPKLVQGAYWLWNAFITLSSQRQHTNNGPQPIRVGDVDAYARLTLVDPTDQEFLLDVVVKMDHEFLTDTYKKLEQERKKKAGRGRRT
jgi:hypothetical protein